MAEIKYIGGCSAITDDGYEVFEYTCKVDTGLTVPKMYMELVEGDVNDVYFINLELETGGVRVWIDVDDIRDVEVIFCKNCIGAIINKLEHMTGMEGLVEVLRTGVLAWKKEQEV